MSLWIISYYIRVRVFTFEEIESEKMIGMCIYIIDRSLIRLSMQESNPYHAYLTNSFCRYSNNAMHTRNVLQTSHQKRIHHGTITDTY